MLSRQDEAIGVPVRVSDKAWVAVSGKVGAECAGIMAERLLKAGADALVSWGSAGALDPILKAGDLFLPDRIINPEGQTYSPDSAWLNRAEDALHSKFTVRRGTLLQTSVLVSTAREKQELYKDLQAEAVDMESAAIAQIAQQRTVPFLAVRVIADTASQGMPRVIRKAIDDYGHVQYSRLLREVCLRPTDLPALLKLAGHFFAARKTLMALSKEVTSGLFVESGGDEAVPSAASVPDRGSSVT